ncbi:ABC transporter substrate-binding protein [Bifidobacterium avesanii]|uniref:Extracellular solute-binding protein n=1 Tax=Bifidobacterium avesanii TaxID=1798157 RepID=A0A7K3TKR1_9BIFI|nr:extracellular solute-binding protein [Bifidobacterium avesanii]KAB8286785.1 ABC transporter substrate-binding protein [Bifidobacterium avesanii]NEG79319.1 extracellular solute-binding protein [Bifidobacterium avesanii]
MLSERSNRNWRIAVPAAIAATVMALSGCGAAGGGSSEVKLSEGDVTLTLNWWGSNNRVKLTTDAIAAFEKLHPNIHVEPTYSDNSGYWDKLATSIAGKEMPDVVQMDEAYLASYASQGTLYDMSGLGNYLKTDTMDSSLLDSGKYEGKLYAAPIASTVYVVVVNNDILDQLGITLPDTDKWSWDDFEQICKEVVEKSNGEVVGVSPMNNPMSLSLWARQHGEEFYTDGKVSIKPETLAEYLQLAYDWTHGDEIAGTPDTMSEQMSGTWEQSNMAKGKQAFGFAFTNQVSSYMKTLGTENLSLAAIPSDDQNTNWMYLKPSQYWSIAATTEHPAEAAELVDFLINNEDAGKILGTERGIPANNAIRDTLMESATGGDKVAMEFHKNETSRMGSAAAITPNGASTLQKMTPRYEQEVAFGRMSAIDAANAMIAELQGNIDSAD